MYEILLSKIENFEYVFIGIAVGSVVIISLIVYNMVRIHNMHKDNTKDHNSHLLSIAMNKHNIKTLKKYIDEENTDMNSAVLHNKDVTITNRANISENLKKIRENNSTIELNKRTMNTEIEKNKDELVDLNRQLVLQNATMSGIESSLSNYKNDQGSVIKEINNKHKALQDKVGVFEYSDFQSLLSNVNSNNITLDNLNTGLGNVIGDMNTLDKRVGYLSKYVDEEIEDIKKDYVKSEDLTVFFNDQILPKFDDVDTNLSDNYMTTTDMNDKFATLTAVNDVSDNLSNNYMTATDMNGQFATLTAMSGLSNNLRDNYMTATDMNGQFATLTAMSGLSNNLRDNYMTATDMNGQCATLTAMSGLSNNLNNNYMTRADLDGRFATITDLELLDKDRFGIEEETATLA